MSTQGHTDFSRQPIPDTWTEAAADAPNTDGKRLSRSSRLRTPPQPDTLDLFSACLAATAVAIVGGIGWYQLQVTGLTTPWTAVVVALVLTVAVRLGGGADDSQSRGVLTLLYYLATSAVVIYLVTRWSYQTSYGSTPGWSQLEDELLNSRLTEPLSLVAWFAGATVSVWGSRFLR